MSAEVRPEPARASTEPASHPRLRLGGPADLEAIAALLERENQRPADRPWIAYALAGYPSVVAEDESGLVGVIYSRRFSPDIMELSNMVVAARLRRRGIGRALVALIEGEIASEGYRAIIGVNCWLHPHSGVERARAARAFWLRMGYRIIFATPGSAVVAKWLH